MQITLICIFAGHYFAFRARFGVYRKGRRRRVLAIVHITALKMSASFGGSSVEVRSASRPKMSVYEFEARTRRTGEASPERVDEGRKMQVSSTILCFFLFVSIVVRLGAWYPM